MPDLWKALGDVYGEAGPDTRSVPTEPPAAAREPELTTSLPLDDDLAAALSAALADGPRSPAPPAPPTPTAPPAAPAATAAVAPPPPVTAEPAPVRPVSPEPAPVRPVAARPVPAAPPQTARPVPPAPVATAVAAPARPTAALPVLDAPEQISGAGERVSAWLADISLRQQLREQGPDLDAVIPETPVWQRGDDDILPAMAKKGRRRR